MSLSALITVARILLCSHSRAYAVAERISGVALSTVIYRMSVAKNRDFSARTALTVARSSPISWNIYGTSTKPLLQASCVLHYIHRSSVYNYCRTGRLFITFLYAKYISYISNNLWSSCYILHWAPSHKPWFLFVTILALLQHTQFCDTDIGHIPFCSIPFPSFISSRLIFLITYHILFLFWKCYYQCN